MIHTFKTLHFKKSINAKLIVGYAVIILLLIIPLFYSLYNYTSLSAQYDKLITNVSNASTLNRIVETDIPNELWDIVAGKKTFDQGRQYEIADDIYARLDRLAQTGATLANRRLVGVVAKRTLDTLADYIAIIKLQIQNNEPVIRSEQSLDEVRAVSQLLYDIVLEFTLSEIDAAAGINQSIQESVKITLIVAVLISVAVILFAIMMLISVSQSIARPIEQLKLMAAQIAEGDLEARAQPPDVIELYDLTNSLNSMAGKIQALLDRIILEQKNLQKSEMAALQAQITPHFLYNTFDTIEFLAECERHKEVMQVTRAFSNFFRISLSRGKDWIPVSQEVEHVRSYLTIQQVRYSDILQYTIELDPQIGNFMMLKLVLQPLVENALYHGIKNRRGKGHITVRAQKQADGLFFSVRDDGNGMTSERLTQMRTLLESASPTERDSDGYGLYNVNKRLKLYYDNSCGLSLTSAQRVGTAVSFLIPIKEHDHV